MKQILTILITLTILQSYAQKISSEYYDDGKMKEQGTLENNLKEGEWVGYYNIG